ncbi:uncharacterized protein LOC122393604 isoform X2 [Amphibalanus amphitrite]|uniref:uncharacterized protein LOC122393604 isoform X2 n=1 Tax=Amphibalanus amphitrite TaxID=1232801 RepID=UPI001C91F5E2|nr:uncharacterized protein LOC122393604 isoform X2 [Amphibalanus amphitrite]
MGMRDMLLKDLKEGHGSMSCQSTQDSDLEQIKTVIHAVSNKKKPATVTVGIEGVDVVMELDTGASCSIINESTYKQLESTIKLQAPQSVLRTYTGHKIPVLGEAVVDVRYGSNEWWLPVIVTKGSGPNLLGRDWLSHIQLDWRSVFSVLQRFQDAGLRVSEKKCRFCVDEVEYLGHLIDAAGCHPSGKKSVEDDLSLDAGRIAQLISRDALLSRVLTAVQYGEWPEDQSLQPYRIRRDELFRSLCTIFGLPDTVVTDNGPAFVGREFQQFVKRNGIRHVTTAPHHPASNGLAERVYARSYGAGPAWRAGTVVDLAGGAMASIRLDDGRVWRRHLDQLRPIADLSPASDVSAPVPSPPLDQCAARRLAGPLPVVEEPAAAARRPPDSAVPDSVVPAGAPAVPAGQLAEENGSTAARAKDSATELPPGTDPDDLAPSLRRSTRVRKQTDFFRF